MTIKEPQLLELDVFISPDDLWPVPPNDELLLETVASYLQKRGEVDDMIEPWLTIHPTEGVLLHWHNEDTRLDRNETDDSHVPREYACIVRLCMSIRDETQNRASGASHYIANCLLCAWNNAHEDKKLPKSDRVAWSMDGIGCGYVLSNDDMDEP